MCSKFCTKFEKKFPTHALITYTQHMVAIQREVYQLEIQTVSKPRTKLIEMIQYIATTSLYRIRSKCKCFLNTVYPYAIKSEIHKQSAFDSPWQKNKKQKKKNNNKKQNLQIDVATSMK